MDRRILFELQADARLSFSELARRVGLSAPAVTERVRKLEEAGVVEGYRAVLDPEKLGYPLAAFVTLNCSAGRYESLVRWLEERPEARAAHHVAGAASFLIEFRVRDVAHLESLLEPLHDFGSTATTIAYSTPVRKTTWQP